MPCEANLIESLQELVRVQPISPEETTMKSMI